MNHKSQAAVVRAFMRQSEVLAAGLGPMQDRVYLADIDTIPRQMVGILHGGGGLSRYHGAVWLIKQAASQAIEAQATATGQRVQR
jgi:hypothetical protein